MRASDLNSNVVLVRHSGKDLYFDPGSAYTPYGLLPWGETDVRGLKLDKDGGAWVTTPSPESSASQIIRKADLKLDSDGTLEGMLTVTFTGLEASLRRVEEHNEDEAHQDRKSTRLNSSHGYISYAVFCLKKKNHSRPRQSSAQSPRRCTPGVPHQPRHTLPTMHLARPTSWHYTTDDSSSLLQPPVTDATL